MAALKGYEILLKPVRKNHPIDWELSISSVLDYFMSHSEDQTKVNFSEAALLLQNSTTFYCKRVDVLHEIVHELFNEVCYITSSENNDRLTEINGPSDAKKGNQVNYPERDDLEVIDFVFSKQNINCDIDEVTHHGTIKQIILNTNMEALRKPGTSVNVYQLDGNLLGCKQDFRMFGFLHSDGTVNRDFNYDPGKVISCIDEPIIDRDATPLPQCDVQNLPGNLGVETPVSGNKPLDAGLADQSTLIDEMLNNPPLPLASPQLNAVAEPITVKKKSYWEPIPHDFKYPLRPLKCKSTILLPKQLLVLADKVGDPQELKNARKKRKRGKAVEKEPEEVNMLWINIAISGPVNALQRKLKIEEACRKVLVSSRKPTVCDPFDEMGDTDDADESDDIEAYVNDKEVSAAASFTRVEDQLGSCRDEKLRAIEKLKERREQKIVSHATEFAKRVAAWHKKIAPILEAAESRSHFDEHEYETGILASFPDGDHETYWPFCSVVAAQPKHEICKYFQSTLTLASMCCLEIKKSSDEYLYEDCVELRLLSKVRHHETINEALRVILEDCSA